MAFGTSADQLTQSAEAQCITYEIAHQNHQKNITLSNPHPTPHLQLHCERDVPEPGNFQFELSRPWMAV